MTKPILCCNCAFFLHVAFTAGYCRRRSIVTGTYPRITVERSWPDDGKRCGPKAIHYMRKRKARIEAVA